MNIEKSQLLNAKTVLRAVGVGHGQVVGDLGCGGKGYFTLQAAKMVGDKGIVYAFDILKSALSSVASRARMERLENVSTVWTNLEIPGAAQVQDGRLDLALLFNILYQAEHRDRVMQEAVRLVRPGGTIAVVDWRKGAGPIGPEQNERMDIEEVRRLAKGLGLREHREFDPGDYHFGIVLIKPS